MPLYSCMRLWDCSWVRKMPAGLWVWEMPWHLFHPSWISILNVSCKHMHGQQTGQLAPSLLSTGCMSVLLLCSLSWNPCLEKVCPLLNNRWLRFWMYLGHAGINWSVYTCSMCRNDPKRRSDPSTGDYSCVSMQCHTDYCCTSLWGTFCNDQWGSQRHAGCALVNFT